MSLYIFRALSIMSSVSSCVSFPVNALSIVNSFFFVFSADILAERSVCSAFATFLRVRARICLTDSWLSLLSFLSVVLASLFLSPTCDMYLLFFYVAIVLSLLVNKSLNILCLSRASNSLLVLIFGSVDV